MNYRSIIVTKRGGSPDTLKIREDELKPPVGKKVRIKIQATPVCQDDVAKRLGNRPFLPKIPFVPGYACLGYIDSVGEEVKDFHVGDRVAALTTYGGYSEYIYVNENELVAVPESLDAAEAAVLMLNYLVAYQILHRVVKVKPNEKCLIIGASGGVGTAFLQLGKLTGLKMYGLASRKKHDVLTTYEAIPIDYRTQDFVEVLRSAEPEGIDYVFNGMGRNYNETGMRVLRKGGTLVQYGAPESMSNLLRLLFDLVVNKLYPRGKRLELYGTHRVELESRKEDWTYLFKLLADKKIEPVISEMFSLFDAAKANEYLEHGKVTGNIVLLTEIMD